MAIAEIKLFKGERLVSTDEWMNWVWYIYVVEYYSAIRRDEVLTHATMWMKLVNMLSERSQNHTIWFHLYNMSKTGKSLGMGDVLVPARS